MKKTSSPASAKHPKERLLAATIFNSQQKDWLTAILSDDQLYTINEAEQALEQFLSQEAK